MTVTPLRDATVSIELGRRVMWDLMTIADYHVERQRVRDWRYQGLPLPAKWEKGVDPLPQRGPIYVVKSMGTLPVDFGTEP